MLELPKRDRPKLMTRGCTACARMLSNSNPKCGKSGMGIRSCDNQQSHVYYSLLRNPFTGSRLPIKLKSLDFWEARKENELYLKASKEMRLCKKLGQVDKCNKIFNSFKSIKEEELETKEVKISSGISIWDALLRYADWLKGETGLSHEKRPGEKEAKSRINTFKQFAKILFHQGINVSAIKLSDVSGDLVDKWYSFMSSEVELRVKGELVKPNRSYSNKTINNKRDHLSMFINWCNNHGTDLTNVFAQVKKLKIQPTGKTITPEEWAELISVIIPDNGFGTHNGKTQNWYRPELVHYFALAYYTGIRRGDLVRLKWSDIKSKEVDGQIRKIIPYVAGKEGLKKVAPVVPDLQYHLDQLDQTGEYIVFDGLSRKNQADFLTDSFSYFAKIAGLDVTLHHCRNRYATWVIEKFGSNSPLSVHTNTETTNKHYADQEFLAAKAAE